MTVSCVAEQRRAARAEWSHMALRRESFAVGKMIAARRVSVEMDAPVQARAATEREQRGGPGA